MQRVFASWRQAAIQSKNRFFDCLKDKTDISPVSHFAHYWRKSTSIMKNKRYRVCMPHRGILPAFSGGLFSELREAYGLEFAATAV